MAYEESELIKARRCFSLCSTLFKKKDESDASFRYEIANRRREVKALEYMIEEKYSLDFSTLVSVEFWYNTELTGTEFHRRIFKSVCCLSSTAH